MTDRLKTRLKSFAWRIGSFGVIELLAFLTMPEVAADLGLPTFVVTVLALISGEITKDLNNRKLGK